MQPEISPDDPRRKIRTIRRIRWVLVSVTAVFAVALILKGQLLIGGFFGAMAVIRGWMLVTMSRRMDAIRGQRQASAQEWRANERRS